MKRWCDTAAHDVAKDSFSLEEESKKAEPGGDQRE